MVLTTSTSEGYGYLFRLLCDAGDEVLVAQPSYPLFDFLADLEDVRLRTYPLFYDHGWWIDFAELERRIGPRTKAIVVVHPNNPTGHATGARERQRLEEICARHGLALIVDEVFLDYPLGEEGLVSFAVGPHPVLTFCLSGMSKIAGLPQMKVGWIVGLGPEVDRLEAMGRLEVIADTFLSMNAPVQVALPVWLAGRAGDSGADSGAGAGEPCVRHKGVEWRCCGWRQGGVRSCDCRRWVEECGGDVVAGGRCGGASGVVLWDRGDGTSGGEFIGTGGGVSGRFGTRRAWSGIEPR